MDFLHLKALHIIFIVTWFAGLFYIVRLFIYHVEAEEKDRLEKEILQTQYKIMEKRLWYIITWPSSILASVFAFWMLYETPYFLQLPWMHIKLLFVLVLYMYHLYCHKIFKDLQQNQIKTTPKKLRLLNEAPTIILFAAVFLVVLKNSLSWIWGVIGILSLGILLMVGIKIYQQIRKKGSWDEQERISLDEETKKNR